MSDRLSDGTWWANESYSRRAVAVDAASETAGVSLAATHKGAMRLTDTAAQTSGGPAGVPERQVGFQPTVQTPAGAARRSPWAKPAAARKERCASDAPHPECGRHRVSSKGLFGRDHE